MNLSGVKSKRPNSTKGRKILKQSKDNFECHGGMCSNEEKAEDTYRVLTTFCTTQEHRKKLVDHGLDYMFRGCQKRSLSYVDLHAKGYKTLIRP